MKVPTRVAMAFAGVDRGRFNEAVWHQHYRCAPETREGTQRDWGEADLVGLTAFGYLTKQGVKPREAGNLACLTVQTLRTYDDLQAMFSLKIFNHPSNPGGWSTFNLPFYGPNDASSRVAYRPEELGPRAGELKIDVVAIRQMIRESDLLREYFETEDHPTACTVRRSDEPREEAVPAPARPVRQRLAGNR